LSYRPYVRAMKKNTKLRRARMVATLEKQFENCQELAETLLSQARESADYYNMPIALALLRIGSQLSATVARLDSDEDDAPFFEIDGSIPK